MMKLSLRMQAIADMVTKGNSVTDVGCDHGYIPIYLIENGISKRARACDVNQEPLQKAVQNIREHGFEDNIRTFLSNGIRNDAIFEDLASDNAGQTLVIAGMGGLLINSILGEDPDKTARFHEMILQPQSKISEVREYLENAGYLIIDESVVFEDGKYYQIMKAQKGFMKLTGMEKFYGPVNIRKNSAAFRDYVLYRQKVLEKILSGIKDGSDERTKDKAAEIEKEISFLKSLEDL